MALQLAADHPDVVRRLVVVSAGYRLGDPARAAQLRYVEAAAAGKRGAQHMAPFKVESAVSARLVAPVMWLLDPLLRPGDTADMVAFARAEDAFDLGPRLGEITAPTLVIAGDEDPLARRPHVLAGAIAGARLHVVAGDHGTTVGSPAFQAAVVDFLRG